MIEVGYERRDRIAYITLNRPEAKNALTPEMHDEMCRLWADFRDDEQADVAILTGVGDAFCAGADLATYVPRNYVDAPPSRVREIVDLGFGGLTRGLHRITKPTIAAVNGWALAGGLELALACDLRVASDRAMFGSGGAISKGDDSRGHRQAAGRSAADRGLEFLHVCRPGRGSGIVASVFRQVGCWSSRTEFAWQIRAAASTQRKIVAMIPAR
jgi:1,4-dihydroxy-2-naphthoyl-CoA synthase